MTFAPPLIWLGAPMKALIHGLPQRFGQVLSNLFRSTPVRRLGKNLVRPRVCWLAATGTLIAWHVPALFMVGLGSQVWHTVEQASFLTTGLLFWLPVINPWPADSSRSEWPILLYLFLATLPCDILSAFLVFCDRAVYPIYFSLPRPLGLSALQDQENAGALMWTCVSVVYLIAGTIVAARLLSPKRPRQYGVVKSNALLNAAPQTAQQGVEVI
jgi:cytochrome c oxidase assembly factor CtaG